MDQYGEHNLYTLECEKNEELDELNLITDHTLQILSRPMSYYVICEDGHPPPIQCPQVKPICLPAKAFESFDSVKSIMQLLEEMPSLKRRKIKSKLITDSVIQPGGSLARRSPPLTSSLHEGHMPTNLTQEGTPKMPLFCHRSILNLNPNKIYQVNCHLDRKFCNLQLNLIIKLMQIIVKLLHKNGGLGTQGGILCAVFDPGGL